MRQPRRSRWVRPVGRRVGTGSSRAGDSGAGTGAGGGAWRGLGGGWPPGHPGATRLGQMTLPGPAPVNHGGTGSCSCCTRGAPQAPGGPGGTGWTHCSVGGLSLHLQRLQGVGPREPRAARAHGQPPAWGGDAQAHQPRGARLLHTRGHGHATAQARTHTHPSLPGLSWAVPRPTVAPGRRELPCPMPVAFPTPLFPCQGGSPCVPLQGRGTLHRGSARLSPRSYLAFLARSPVGARRNLPGAPGSPSAQDGGGFSTGREAPALGLPEQGCPMIPWGTDGTGAGTGITPGTRTGTSTDTGTGTGTGAGVRVGAGVGPTPLVPARARRSGGGGGGGRGGNAWCRRRAAAAAG